LKKLKISENLKLQIIWKEFVDSYPIPDF
jgi:hypothetical protein